MLTPLLDRDIDEDYCDFQDDTMLFISFSGCTPELLLILPHVPPTVSVIAMTSHTQASACPLLSYHTPEMGILLPAPVHEDEEFSFGVCAPTSSTTVALSLGDALSLAVARKLHTLVGRGPAEVFKSLHPGGAIGAASVLSTPKSSICSTNMSASVASSNSSTPSFDYMQSGSMGPIHLPRPARRISPQLVTQSAGYVPIAHIPTASSQYQQQKLCLLDVLLMAIQHPDAKSWIFLSETEVIPPRAVRSLSQQHRRDADGGMHKGLSDLSADRLSAFSVHREKWLRVSSLSTIDEVRQALLAAPGSEDAQGPVVVAIMRDDSCLGVIEADDLRER